MSVVYVSTKDLIEKSEPGKRRFEIRYGYLKRFTSHLFSNI